MEKLVELRKLNYKQRKEMQNNKIKDSIFGVLYVLLKDYEEPEVLSFILGVIEFLEFLGFPFNESVIKLY